MIRWCGTLFCKELGMDITFAVVAYKTNAVKDQNETPFFAAIY